MAVGMIPADLDLLSNILYWVLKCTFKRWFSSSQFDDDSCRGTHYKNSAVEMPLEPNTYLVGTVTNIIGDNAVISNRYNFSVSGVKCDVHLGTAVTFTLSSQNTVTFVEVIDAFKEKSLDDKEDYFGLVAMQSGSEFTISPGPIVFDINLVSAEFMPEVGDLVKFDKIDTSSKSLNQRISHISPVGYKSAYGRITHFNGKVGFICNDVKFEVHHCRPGYEPVIGDDVHFSAIRCRCGDIKYRTVHVTPFLTNSKLLAVELIGDDLVFHPREIIRIYVNKTENVRTTVKNHSKFHVEMLGLTAYSQRGINIAIIEPKNLKMILKSGSSSYFTFEITINSIGFHTVHFEYRLKNRFFTAEMTILALSENLARKKQGLKYEMLNKQLINLNYLSSPLSNAIPGRRIFKPSNFIPVKLGKYPIPKRILDLYASFKNEPSFNQLALIYPSLGEGLHERNYTNYWHSLLYNEEIEALKEITELNVRAGLIAKEDYLCLLIDENSKLSTILLPGDRAYVKPPFGDKYYEGIIWVVHSYELLMKFDKHFHSAYTENTLCEIYFVMGRKMFQLKHQAVDDVYDYLGVAWLFPHKMPYSDPYIIPVSHKSEEDPIIPLPTRQKLIFNRRGSGYGNNQNIYKLKNDLPKLVNKYIQWYYVEINEEQKEAVINILEAVCRPLPYIIFGPPGTGKSITVIESILQIYNHIIGSNIIVAAPSNSAVDFLTLGLIGSGFIEDGDLIRLCSYNYASDMKNINVGVIKFAGVAERDIKVLSQNATRVDSIPNVDRYQIAEKRIVVTTLGSLGILQSMGFPRGHFTHFFIDEAAQVSEPECLIVSGLMTENAHLVLAGDPKQLGPFSQSKMSEQFGFNRSFLKRMMMSKLYSEDRDSFPKTLGFNPKLITKLVKSYRAVPPLLFLPNVLFYNGELQSMVRMNDGEKADIYEALKPILPPECHIPLLFHSVKGREEKDLNAYSFFNCTEAFQVCSYLARVYKCGVGVFDVGVITPYIAQKKEIVKHLLGLKIPVPKIGSVEEFQGQEKKVIILSLVRSTYSNSSSCTSHSFIFQPERINVAITRAEVMLIIIGDSEVLREDDNWNQILWHCQKYKSFISSVRRTC